MFLRVSFRSWQVLVAQTVESGRAQAENNTTLDCRGITTARPIMRHGTRQLIAACLIAVAVFVRGDGVDGADGAADGPLPVAQMTLTMTDGAGKQSPVVATVLQDEDAAAAAVRFCFDKGLTQPGQVLDITGYLKGALAGKEHEPENIELLRTAGAYSRRAAESSKEENYLEAAAGLYHG